MSDFSNKMIKRLVIPVVFTASAIHLPVYANTIRILGPADEALPVERTVSPAVSPTVSAVSAVRSSQNTVPSANNRYGPTTQQETLWSIASRYRPTTNHSVYQVIGAIYRLNPQAFEGNNIHGLQPGSVLVIPTPEQISRESTDLVKRQLERDKHPAASGASSQRTASSQKPAPKPAPKPVEEAKAPKKVAVSPVKPEVKSAAADKKDGAPAKPVVNTDKKADKKPADNNTETPPAKPTSALSSTALSSAASQAAKSPAGDGGTNSIKPDLLQAQLDASDEQMNKLLESNHLLRVRLAEMQHEVAALKTQITADEQLRGQIKDFIDQQKGQQAAQQPNQPKLAPIPEPGFFDNLISNPLALLAMMLVPSGLIVAAGIFFMRRRKNEEDDELLTDPDKGPESPSSPDLGSSVPEMDLDMESKPDAPEPDLDDLFKSEDALFDDNNDSLFGTSNDSLDLDDYSVGNGLGPSSISVKGDEKAIGLEDMERALDELDQKVDSSSDADLAAMWEKSLSGNDEEDSFDLTLDDDDLLLDSDQNDERDDLLDQSMLDDLLTDSLPTDTPAVDRSATENRVAPEAARTEPVADSLVDQNELDALFDNFDSFDEDIFEEKNDAKQQAAVDKAVSDAEMLAQSPGKNESVDQDELDALWDLPQATASDLDGFGFDDLADEGEEKKKGSEPQSEVEPAEPYTNLLAQTPRLNEGEELDGSDILQPQPVPVEPQVALDEPKVAVEPPVIDSLVDMAFEPQNVKPELDPISQAKPPVDVDVLENGFDEHVLDGFDENSVVLLDELVKDEDELSSDIDLEENSVELLDEVLGEDEDELHAPDIKVDENSTELLDEVLAKHNPKDPSELEAESQEPENVQPEAANRPADIDQALFEDARHAERRPYDQGGHVPGEADHLGKSEPEQPVEPERSLEPEDMLVAATDADADVAEVAPVDDRTDEMAEETVQPEVEAPAIDVPAVDADAASSVMESASTDFADEAYEAYEADEAYELLDDDLAADSDEGEQGVGQTVDQLLQSLEAQGAVDVDNEELHDAPLAAEAFPVYDEEAALADLDAQEPVDHEHAPIEVSDLAGEAPAPVAPEALSLEDLPEFDEESAWNDPEAEFEIEPAKELSADEEQVMLDNIVKQLQQAAEAVERAPSVPDTHDEDTSVDAEFEPASNMPFDAVMAEAMANLAEQEEGNSDIAGEDLAADSQAPAGDDEPAVSANEFGGSYSIHGRQDIQFETLDPNSLPEFGEDDALQASFDEQNELEQYELEHGLKQLDSGAQFNDRYSGQSGNGRQEAGLDEVMINSAGLDMDALLNEPVEDPADHQPEKPALQVPPVLPQADSKAVEHGFEENGRELLEQEREELWSLSDMSTEDSSLSDDELSQEDSAIWAASNPEPLLEGEDWSTQPEMHREDVADAMDNSTADKWPAEEEVSVAQADDIIANHEVAISEAVTELPDSELVGGDEAGSELLDESVAELPRSSQSPYISIDDLLKELDEEDESLAKNLDEEPLNLNVGLDEFPDVLDGVASFDVDSQGEFASKMDLAKAYLEMNDNEGARGLLQEIAEQADAKLQQEAKEILRHLR